LIPSLFKRRDGLQSLAGQGQALPLQMSVMNGLQTVLNCGGRFLAALHDVEQIRIRDELFMIGQRHKTLIGIF